MSLTLSLTSKSSLIDIDYFPPIDLKDVPYELALINFETFNSIPNIDETNNKFYIDNGDITVPSGSYELKDLEEYLNSKIRELKKLNDDSENPLILRGNRKTLKSEIYCLYSINFKKENNLGSILGFENVILEAEKLYESTRTVNIFKVNTIRILCNIITGAYSNNKLVHSIFEFSPNVPTGYKISITPNNIIYFPVTVRKITNLSVKICDQNDELVNFRNEVISIRLHLRPKK